MEKQYKIARETVYAGYVVEKVQVRSYLKKSIVLRNMLFSLRDNQLAHDLLQQDFVYPIEGLAEKGEIRKTPFYIQGAVCLEPLLKALDVPFYLTPKEIKIISNTLFTGSFCMEHYKLFGLDQDFLENASYLKNGKLIYDPRKAIDYLVEFYEMAGELEEDFFTKEEAKVPLSLFNKVDAFGSNGQPAYISFMPHAKEITRLNKKL